MCPKLIFILTFQQLTFFFKEQWKNLNQLMHHFYQIMFLVEIDFCDYAWQKASFFLLFHNPSR